LEETTDHVANELRALAALLAIAAVLYREAGTLSLTSCILISFAVVIVFIAHAWHWACAYASDEKGFSLMHYYETQLQDA
jgi:hypothetical protein